MADIKTKYPQSNADTVSIGITLTSLAASASLVAGRESDVVDNTSNLDEDHLVSGKTAIQSNASTGVLEVWAYAPIKIASGTPEYGKCTGADAAVSFDSRNQVLSAMRLLWSCRTDASVARSYFMPPTSIRQAFGEVPARWGIVVMHSHGAALSSTAGDHAFGYHRVQKQVA